MSDEPGLRERKRLAAMRRAQEVAIDLFDAHGYDGVTIEQIAGEAELSPSSIYRYFGTKEQLVLWDEYDPQILERIGDELAHRPPVDAVHRAVRSVFAEVFERDEPLIRRRVHYSLEEPAVAATVALEMDQLAEVIGAVLGEHTEHDAGDLEVRVVASAITGAIVAAIRAWHAGDYEPSFGEVMDRTFAVLRAGLDLDHRAPPSHDGSRL